MNKPLELNNRILLVDDHRPIHQDFRDILTFEKIVAPDFTSMETAFFGDSSNPTTVLPQYELDSAYQGQEALERVKAAQERRQFYSLIFMDVRMPPGWDGIETIQRIWEVTPDTQVVICTAYADYSWENIFEKFGQTDNLVFLRKPFDHTEVRQLASALTNKWNYAAISRLKMEELEKMVQEKTRTLAETVKNLQDALANIKTLKGLLPICASCKKIRNDKGFWDHVETYVAEHSDANFSHGICPACIDKLYPEVAAQMKQNKP
jgi:CheY-like chemotaxis protein